MWSMKKGLRNYSPNWETTRFLFSAFIVLVLVIYTGVAQGEQKKTVAELALYQGADREKILIEGAKKEQQLTFYNSNVCMNVAVVKGFEKKYPFVKVSAWRSDSQDLVKRTAEEFKARHYLLDVVETSHESVRILQRQGILQEYYSPEAAFFEEELKEKGKKGMYFLGDREEYNGLGFNTTLVPPAEAPKTWKDLLDPKWKGKMSIAGSSTGVRWIGNIIGAMGREYLDKLSQQNIKVQNVSGAGLAGLVVSGEVPLSPNIWISNIVSAKRKKAPVEWQPLEPVLTNLGSSGMSVSSPHPHASLLFLDYVHSSEGQKIAAQCGVISPRKDIRLLERKFKKNYLGPEYSLEEYEKKYAEWDGLLKNLFIKK